jgi:thiol:disulfide interchange protein DsbD
MALALPTALTLAALAAAVLPPAQARGQAGAGNEPADTARSSPHVKAALVSERSAVAPGQLVELGVSFEIEPGWHLYGAARNDSGLPIAVVPELPAGWQAGALRWPAPERHRSPGDLLDHVYTGRVLLLLPVQVAADAQAGETAHLRARLDWLVCKDICLGGDAEVALDLPVVADAAQAQATAAAPLFAAARARLPQPLPEGHSAGAPDPVHLTLGQRSARLVAPGASGLVWIPATDCTELPELIREGEAEGDTLTLTLDIPPAPPGGAPAARLTGCVEVRYPPSAGKPDGETRFYALDRALDPASIPRVEGESR